MKISKKEKFLLGILGIVFITVMYYQFVFTPQSEKVKTTRVEKDEKEQEYNKIVTTIQTLEKKKSEVKSLNSGILEKSKIFYPVLLQEKIILELDTLLQSSGLDGNISFSPIEVAGVEKFESPEVDKGQSSLKVIVDEYNKLVSDEVKDGQDSEENSETTTENTTVEGGGDAAGTTEAGAEQAGQLTGTTTEQLKVAISFTGTYEGLKSFLDLLDGGSRDIAVTNIAITPSSDSYIAGTMNLEFYGVPKIGDEDMEYLKWTLSNTYGKETPFSEGAASGAYSSTIEELSENADVRDFVMMLRAPSSELPTLTIGKSKDSLKESYLYSDKTKVEDVEIHFIEEDGVLYYKYNTSGSVYPKTNTETGKEFTAVSSNIVVEISSESRLGSADKSGINLKVKNDTTKTVEVIIKNDDSTNPRVAVSTEGNTVNVTKK